MTPGEFISKWSDTGLRERAASHSHFIDLCHLLGEKAPTDADPRGEWYAFEKGAMKTGGGDGWADVWKRGCFAWEYKSPGKDLNAALKQLQYYVRSLENPPLLIVSDMERIELHTNWTNTVQEVHILPLPELADAAGGSCSRRRSHEPNSNSTVLERFGSLEPISGTTRESVVSEAFKTLLKDWGRSRDLIFIPQYEYQTLQKKTVYPDGALLHELRVPFGYWEAKDEDDDLDAEIEKKIRRGYPQDNIIFEDSREAVLIQNRQEVMRCEMDGRRRRCDKLMELFFGYERKEIAEFRKAVEQFKIDLPAVLAALRTMIEEAHARNAVYQAAEAKFLKHAQETINPTLGTADVREMLIQHILTEEIFAKVFDDSDFHTHNNIAKELYALEATFFTGSLKKQTLRALDPYYAAIRASAAQITQPRREADLPQGHLRELLQGLQRQGRRPTWAWSTRRTRSCAS